jgi:hypothetical protein
VAARDVGGPASDGGSEAPCPNPSGGGRQCGSSWLPPLLSSTYVKPLDDDGLAAGSIMP